MLNTTKVWAEMTLMKSLEISSVSLSSLVINQSELIGTIINPLTELSRLITNHQQSQNVNEDILTKRHGASLESQLCMQDSKNNECRMLNRSERNEKEKNRD